MHGPRVAALSLLVLALTSGVSRGQESNAPPPSIDTSPQEAGDDDNARPRRRLVNWNA